MQKQHIQAGTLSLSLNSGANRLHELVDFASRENEKRGFLFVSKVLGKHIPVRPSVMRATYDELAQLCELSSNCLVVGMAETATGLGAGVADSLARQCPQLDVFYQHTTRHALDHHQPWFTLSEKHSHAVDHIMYQPNDDVRDGLTQAEHLVLVDDEITTGQTLLQLGQGLCERLPNIRRVTVVSLVSWLTPGSAEQLEQLAADVRFVNLIKGTFEFEPAPDFSATLPTSVDKGLCTEPSRDDLGRTGMKMPWAGTLEMPEAATAGAPIVVIGTGEHLYYPFLVAEKIAQHSDVVFQSTTRSPILKGDAIQRKTVIQAGDGKQHYIYNLPAGRHPLVLCETEAMQRNNGLVNGRHQEIM